VPGGLQGGGGGHGGGSLAAPGAVAVQRHLGHRDVATTLRIYRHLFAGRTDQLVDALDALYVEAQTEIASVPSVVRPLTRRRKA